MVMRVESAFPTDLFLFDNSSIQHDKLIEAIKLSNHAVKHSGVISLLQDFRNDYLFLELFTWFNECLEQIRTYMDYDCEKFTITNSWCNISLAGSGMGLNFHKHSLSFLSGVYYLSDGAPTVFEDPVIHRTQAQIEVLRKNYRPIHTVPAQQGRLCIFPSWMYHGTLAHWDNNDRYVISFNAMPDGKINYETATDSKGHIKIL